jgi:hypothetical protein
VNLVSNRKYRIAISKIDLTSDGPQPQYGRAVAR